VSSFELLDGSRNEGDGDKVNLGSDVTEDNHMPSLGGSVESTG
jgi:hypothetical protein